MNRGGKIKSVLILLSAVTSFMFLYKESWASCQTCYKDMDGDGYSDGTTTITCSGSCPSGYASSVLGTNDCNDNNASICPTCSIKCFYLCDSSDTDQIFIGRGDNDEDGWFSEIYCIDDEDYTLPDGFTFTVPLPDCDDNNPDINPGAHEVCGDNIDNDCSTYTCGDSGCSWEAPYQDGIFVYEDKDGDKATPERVSFCVNLVKDDNNNWVLPDGVVKVGEERSGLDCIDETEKNLYTYTEPMWEQRNIDGIFLSVKEAFSEFAINTMLARYILKKMSSGVEQFVYTFYQCDAGKKGDSWYDVTFAETVAALYGYLMSTPRIFKEGEVFSLSYIASDMETFEDLKKYIFQDGLTVDFYPTGETDYAINKYIFVDLFAKVFPGEMSGPNPQYLIDVMDYLFIIMHIGGMRTPWFMAFLNDYAKQIVQYCGYKELRYMMKAVHQSIFGFVGRNGVGFSMKDFLDGYEILQGCLATDASSPEDATEQNTYAQENPFVTSMLSFAPIDDFGYYSCHLPEVESRIKSLCFNNNKEWIKRGWCRVKIQSEICIIPEEGEQESENN